MDCVQLMYCIETALLPPHHGFSIIRCIFNHYYMRYFVFVWLYIYSSLYVVRIKILFFHFRPSFFILRFRSASFIFQLNVIIYMCIHLPPPSSLLPPPSPLFPPPFPLLPLPPPSFTGIGPEY